MMSDYRKFVIVIMTVFVLLVSVIRVEAQVGFSYQSEYSFMKGKDAGSLPATWMNPDFDFSGWEKSKSPFRYGNGEGGTELTDMQGKYSSMYLRSSFECLNKDFIKELSINVDYDDGFILWINGVIAISKNAPSVPAYNSFATTNHESGTGENFIVSTASLNLINGINTIAVQAFNISLTSTDFYFDLDIQGEQTLPVFPGNQEITFSVNSGFFNEPFSVTLASSDPLGRVIYTLDGSNPQSSANSFTSDSPVSVLIDPDNSNGRPLTPSVVIRASVVQTGYKPSLPESRTYIFLRNVKTQTWPGGGWPSSAINGQLIDLEMDSEVVNSAEYSDLIEESLLDIPSISIVTDLKNLFDPSSGIYVNALGHGLNWEKECSVELIQPDGSDGFNVNAGLRMRGGYSRTDLFPKHSFRLFFREKYGNDKLYFPLFGDEGTDHFDKIDLRTEQNYGWNNGSKNNSFVREVFSRDTQRDMGDPYTRSRYYHLYLNGMYWGLYQTQERSEARYAASYFGNNYEDYDVIKITKENSGHDIEATDGSLDSWSALYNMCVRGFSSNSDYFRLEGKDSEGNPVKGGSIMVDIDNLIDYMMVIFYTGNFDAPTTSFQKNKHPNNFYAVDNREDKSTGFIFFAHDSEHTLFDEPHSPGIGLYENRVNIGERTDEYKMEVTSTNSFHPQWLHFRLTENAEYRVRFADRAYKLLSDDGVLSPTNSMKRLNMRVAEVQDAVIAESARWGDAKRTGAAYTKDNAWIPEIEKIRTKFIPLRTNILIGQLKAEGLYPEIQAPVISSSDKEITEEHYTIESNETIKILNPNTSGTIYYTTDGSDPRKTGGGINSGTSFSLDDVEIETSGSTLLKARILSDGSWSALRQVNLIKDPEDYSDLKVTELFYNPADHITGADTTEGKDLEFIEFKNTGTSSVNLSGLTIDSAVVYQFPDNELLAPKHFFVVSSKPSNFYNNYGLTASGNFKGNLSNGGEELLLKDSSGNIIIDFTYLDSDPWPSKADGDGYSLSSKEFNPSGDPSDYSYWTLSVRLDGTPFADNIEEENEVDPLKNGELVVYPNPTPGLITIKLDTDADTDTEISRFDVTLFDFNGRQITKETIGNPGLIDLSGFSLTNGIYILKVVASGYSARIPVIYKKQ